MYICLHICDIFTIITIFFIVIDFNRSCLYSTLHSPMDFFVANPKGRVLNRFAKDQNIMDEALPVTLFDCVQCILFCIASVLLVCISIPLLTLMFPFVFYHFYVCREKYMRSSREIKRIEAITRSPIYAEFLSTIEGLSTLRAYRLEKRATATFNKHVDLNGRAWFSFLMASRWLGFRLDMQCFFILIVTAIAAVAIRQNSDIDVGLLGFALVYILALSGLFQWAVRQSAEVETQMTSVERISEYMKLPPEPGYAKGQKAIAYGNEMQASYRKIPDSDQSEQQRLSIKAENFELIDFTSTYRIDLQPVLKQINLSIPAGFKVGVCGRTGSGKSSLLLAILRLNLITGGDMRINGRSMLEMELETARSLVSVIPQDPHLFSGTIRFNLDPFNLYTDEMIWSALRDAHIEEYVRRDPLGLSGVVEEGGKNFSVGQRQLLSLSRAILRKCPLVLLDEVTASIDYHTDKLIQETIRKSDSLRSSIIITVAHRLRTIADSDLIVVIQSGTIAEKGDPYDLLCREESLFKALVEESNDFEDIMSIAKTKSESSLREGDINISV